MYLRHDNGSSYYKGTQACHRREDFLILASDNANRLYACVRKVALHQCGHFMMGKARIKGFGVILSGSYGHDGLPLDYSRLNAAQREAFVEVPRQVAQAYWHPENPGWNNAGSEANLMRRWALGI